MLGLGNLTDSPRRAEDEGDGAGPSDGDGHEQQELWLAGSKASRHGWVRVCDATDRTFYHNIDSGRITLERPADFGDDNPSWADGTELYMYRGKCSRCQDFVPRSEAGPVALSADRGQVALSFLLCRPCLNWLVESVKLEREGKPAWAPRSPPPPAQKPAFGGAGFCKSAIGLVERLPLPQPKRQQQLFKIYKNTDLRGMGDLLAKSRLARSYAKCMYSDLSQQTLRPGRFDDQRAECLKAKAAAVIAGEGRRRAAREIQMKLRCISQHKTNGAGDYLCWFSPEGRVDYFGETSGGRAHGWGLAEYQDGSWCLGPFAHGQQHTTPGGRVSTIAYANGIRYEGEMKQGKPHGAGTKTWPNGTEYIGQFAFGKEHGEGTKKFPDGSQHSGKWRAGHRNGPGVFIDARGQKRVGDFRDNVFGKAEEDGIVAPSKADITIESGQYDPETLVDLAISTLAVVTDRQPALNKASALLMKMPLHLHPLVAAAFALSARGLSAEFRAALPSFAWRKVAEVRLCNAPLLSADTGKLSFFLEAIPNLKKLTVIACKLVGEAIGPVADAIATSQTLEEADLSWNPFRLGGVRLVIAALETSPCLRRLSLAGCQLGVDGGRALIAAIGSDREKFRLLDLDLANNSLGAGSGESLAVALRRNETLTRLNLRANSLGPDGGTSLAAGLARNCGMLKELIVADNRFGPNVATLVAASMRGGTSQCLRGFGYRDVRLGEVFGDGNNAAPPFGQKDMKDGQRSALSPGTHAGDAEETTSLRSATGTRPTRAEIGDVPRYALAPTRPSSLGIQRTSAVQSFVLRGGSQESTMSVGTGTGIVGSGNAPENVPVAFRAALEQEIGRPQTAGTASG